MIVAAASGKKAFESLDLILTTIESALPEDSKLLLQGAKGKINKEGNIEDNKTINALNKVILSLIETINDETRNPIKIENDNDTSR